MPILNKDLLLYQPKLLDIEKQENRWKRRMFPKWLLSIKGRTCIPTPQCTPRHDKENKLLWKKIRREN